MSPGNFKIYLRYNIYNIFVILDVGWSTPESPTILLGMDEGVGGRGILFYTYHEQNFYKMTIKRYHPNGDIQIRCSSRKCPGKNRLTNSSGLEKDVIKFFNSDYFQMVNFQVRHNCRPIDMERTIEKIRMKLKMGEPISENTQKLHAALNAILDGRGLPALTEENN
jgi:hypothetical protein